MPFDNIKLLLIILIFYNTAQDIKILPHKSTRILFDF